MKLMKDLLPIKLLYYPISDVILWPIPLLIECSCVVLVFFFHEWSIVLSRYESWNLFQSDIQILWS